PLKGMLWGTGITSVIQSSAVMTVTVVGLTNAGMIRLRQAIAVIMGANVGTTLTAWILSLSGIEGTAELIQLFRPATLSAVFAVVGVVILVFVRSDRGKLLSSAWLSLAILFFGMMTMTEIALSLGKMDFLSGVLSGDVHPLLCFAVGILITAALQSSSAMVGVIQAVSVAGFVPVSVALPLLFGVEIGACTAAILSSMGASKEAKRAALAHLMFNVIGAVVFFVIYALIGLIFDPAFYSAPISIFGIAIVHSLFNLILMICLLPAVSKMEKFLCYILPDGNEDPMDVVVLENRFLFSPSFAAKHSYNALLEMVSLVYENLMDALHLIYAYDKDAYHHLVDTKSLVDEYEKKLRRYLTSLSRKELTEKDGDALGAMLCSAVMLKRLDQIAVDIGKTSLSSKSQSDGFSFGAELKVLTEPFGEMIRKTLSSFEKNDKDQDFYAQRIDSLMALCDDARSNCRMKLATGEYDAENAIAMITYIGHLERIAECCEELSSYIQNSDFSLCENQKDLS
ncbi:MAG: Na/Pi symporter, partial [Firmicutes bacterium]|nr:Na/Pi symporter [Bacillota bacterium]